MNINATLIGQMITFLIFVLFTMKFVWPPIMKALDERKKRIADGLAAAERSVHELELARHKAADLIREAKIQSALLVEQAGKRASQVIEDAKQEARNEAERLTALGREEIAREVVNAKAALREQLATLIVLGASKIIGREMDTAANSDLLDTFIEEMR